jgi:N utilization substance protein B
MRNSRRQAREAGLKALYEMDIAKTRTDDAVAEMQLNNDLSPELQTFAEDLVRKVKENQAFLDGRIESCVLDYDFDRIALVDRNLLRIATCELFYFPHIPPAVSINEAIELAKKYSTKESGRFVNGVLGKLLKESPKAEWDPSLHPNEFESTPPPEPTPEVEPMEALEGEELAKAGPWILKSEGNKR